MEEEESTICGVEGGSRIQDVKRRRNSNRGWAFEQITRSGNQRDPPVNRSVLGSLWGLVLALWLIN